MNDYYFIKYFSSSIVKGLTPSERILCGFISSLSQKHGYCYASNAKLAEYIGISNDAVRKVLSRLIAKNIVKNIGNKFDRKLILTFTENSQDRNGQNVLLEETNGQIDTSNGQNALSSSIYNNKKYISSLTESNDIDFFNEFWKIYPRKSNKSAAQKKFNGLSAKKQEHIITLTRYFADAMKDRTEEFIPMATTYLNQERYLDYEQENVSKKSEILQPKEGAELQESGNDVLDALVSKVLKLVEMYRAAKSDEEAKKLNAKTYESFNLAKEGMAVESFFSSAELAVLKEVGADIKAFAEYEWRDGEIKRLLKGYVC